MKKILFVIIILSVLQSCGENNTVYKPESSGRINSITVVLDNKSWDNKIGDKIRALYADEFMGLPQIEERFTLKQMPYETFDGFSRTSRNIIFINKKSELDYEFQKNKFANPQIYLEIRGTSLQSIIEQLDLSSNEAIRKFSNGEIEENKRRILKSTMNDLKAIDKFSISIKMPSAYSLYKEEKNFIWYQKPIDKGHSNLIITELFAGKDVFDYTIDEVTSLRDSVGRSFLLGRNENSFMITEKEYLPLQKKINYYGIKMLETRGTWEVQGDFMGGPFINYIVEDKVNNRVLFVEGFVFAPSKRKRDNIIELEAIIKSIKFEQGSI